MSSRFTVLSGSKNYCSPENSCFSRPARREIIFLTFFNRKDSGRGAAIKKGTGDATSQKRRRPGIVTFADRKQPPRKRRLNPEVLRPAEAEAPSEANFYKYNLAEVRVGLAHLSKSTVFSEPPTRPADGAASPWATGPSQGRSRARVLGR